MYFYLTEEQQEWKNNVRSFLENEVTEDLLDEMRENEHTLPGPLETAFQQKIVDRGWNKTSWPKELGGLDLSEMDKFILTYEIHKANAPFYVSSIVNMIGATIYKYGTQENKEYFIPKILNGEITFALGYSEPESGTDLASLKTAAISEGDEWVINGQKTWNTVGHRVTHQWLLARTGAPDSKHKGLSLFLVPNNAPGVTIIGQNTWGDHTTNDVYFENVRIPKNHLIGEMNNGWAIVNYALALERITMGEVSVPYRIFEETVAYARETVIDGCLLIEQPEVLQKLVELEIELEIGELLTYEVVNKLDNHLDVSADAAMIKVYATELTTKVADFAMQIFGCNGQFNWRNYNAPIEGRAEQSYRVAPFYRFGGGTNEVQRNIIAQRGLNLPRK